MKTTRKIRAIILILLTYSINTFALAPPFPPPSDNTPGMPINIGIYFLMLSGVIVGMRYKICNKKTI